MPLDPSIIMAGMRNQDLGSDIMHGMQFGQQMAAQRQQMQAQRIQLQEAQAERDRQAALDRALAQNPGNREAALAQLRSGGHGRAAQSQEMQWGKYDLEQAKLKKEEQKATLEADLASAETRSRLAFTAINAFNQGDVNEAQRVWTAAGMPGGFDIAVAKSEFNKGIAAKDQLTQLLEREKFEAGKKERNEAPLSSVAKLNADLKAGRITQDQFQAAYKDATTKGPMVQVGFSQPFEVTDPDSGKPVLVQQDKQGNLRQVAGYAPKANERPPTEGQANALGFGMRALESDRLMSELEQGGETGGGLGARTLSLLPGGNFLKGEKTQKAEQAKMNFITAVLRKESGAAIGADEFRKEDNKYFGQPGDSPGVIAQKQAARQLAIDVLRTQAGRDLPAPSQGATKPAFTLAQIRDRSKRTGESEKSIIDAIRAKGGTVK